MSTPASFTTGEGKGIAKVFGKQEAESIIPQGAERYFFNKHKEELARKEQLQKNLQSIQSYTNLIPQNTEEVRKDIDDLGKFYVDARSTLNTDPFDPTSPANAPFTAKKAQIETKLAQEKLAAERLKAIQGELLKNGTKYDQQEVDKFNTAWQNASSMDERNRIILESQPLVPNIDFFEGFEPPVAAAYGKPTQEELETNAELYILNSQAKTNGDFLEAGKRKGLWTDADSAKKFYIEKGRLEAASNKAPRVGSGGSGGSGGGGNNQRTGKILATHDSSKGYVYNTPNETNVVRFVDDKGKQLPPQQLVDSDGETLFFQVEELRKANKGGGWKILGRQAKRIPTDQYAKLPDNQKAAFQMDEETGDYVSITQTELVELPISNDPSKKGYSNYETLSRVGGADIFEVVQNRDLETIGTTDPYGKFGGIPTMSQTAPQDNSSKSKQSFVPKGNKSEPKINVTGFFQTK